MTISMEPTTVPDGLKTLAAALGYALVAFVVLRLASTHGQNFGPMVASTLVPFGFSFGLMHLAGFSVVRCAAAAAFVYFFLLFSIWQSGFAAVGALPLVLMPLSVFLGHAAGDLYHQSKYRG